MWVLAGQRQPLAVFTVFRKLDGMSKGTIIGIRGLGNNLWSDGITTLVDQMVHLFGWRGKTFNHYDELLILNWLAEPETTGPIVFVVHSMGANTGDKIAELFGRPVAAFFSVDSAWPETLPENVNKVFSITAETGGRFNVKGGKVVSSHVIPRTTHTTVDNAQEVFQLVRDELHRLTDAQQKEAIIVDNAISQNQPVKGNLFNHWTPIFMKMLMEDFVLSVADAAAVFGNGGHESAGYETLQEIKPVVAGSRGGYGIMQWTGPRRRAFEAYCERNNYSPSDMMTNYKWLFVELKGPEGKVLAKLKAANSLADKTKVFSNTFLRPGIPHMGSRQKWAERAMAAWQGAQAALPPPVTTPDNLPASPDANTGDIAVLDVKDLEAMETLELSHFMQKAAKRVSETMTLISAGTTILEIRAAKAAGSGFNPNAVIDAANPKENTMLTGSKSLFKSKTIIGLIGAAVSIFIPQLTPVVDILTPETVALPPEAVQATKDGLETIITSISNIAAALSLLFAAYGRKVATEKIG